MDAVKPYVIGVDLGGTNTVFGIVTAAAADTAIAANKTAAVLFNIISHPFRRTPPWLSRYSIPYFSDKCA